MKRIAVVFLLILVSSCKTKAVLAEGTASNTTISSEKIIENHYNYNKVNFSTLNIKAGAKYEDEKTTQNVTAEIRIKKDEKILVIIRVLGITMAKALITPESVQYYEKINSNYFEGDYEGLSKFLGSKLDYNKVQNLFLGDAVDDLHKENFTVAIIDKLYKLENKNNNKSFFFEADNYLLKKQEIIQPEEERSLQIVYPDFKKYDQMILPLALAIEANQKKGKTNINIEYKNATFNEEISFPYSVPEGYERIFIDKKN